MSINRKTQEKTPKPHWFRIRRKRNVSENDAAFSKKPGSSNPLETANNKTKKSAHSSKLLSSCSGGNFLSLSKERGDSSSESSDHVNFVTNAALKSSLRYPRNASVRRLHHSDSSVYRLLRKEQQIQRSPSTSNAPTSTSRSSKNNNSSSSGSSAHTSSTSICQSSSDDYPPSSDDLSLPEPPDGGFGWVIVVAAFFIHMITDGITVSFAMLIEDLVDNLDESVSETSLIGSFSYGVPMLFAPVSAFLIKRYGCRWVCIVGGVVSSVGCLAAFFAHSVLMLVLTFGILSGVGQSLCYTAALTSVSLYFEGRRATATGLSVAGMGLGALVFAPLVAQLVLQYTWRGTMLVLAGILLQCCVFGALLRPVETSHQRKARHHLAILEHLAKRYGLAYFTKSHEYTEKPVKARLALLRSRLTSPTPRPPTRNPMSLSPTANTHEFELIDGEKGMHGEDEAALLKMYQQGISYLYHGSFQENFILARSRSCTSMPELVAEQRRRRRGSSSSSDSSEDSTRCSCGRVWCWQGLCGLRGRSRATSPGESAFLRDPDGDSTTISSSQPSIVARLKRYFDWDIYRNVHFLLFTASNCIMYFWYSVTYIFLPFSTKPLKIPAYQDAYLISTLGASNVIGEVLLGWLADRGCINTLLLYFVCILLLGLITCFVPLLNSYALFCVYAVSYGFCFSASDALCSVLLVEFVGLKRFTSGLGVCLFYQGVANILGPPAIGFLIDHLGAGRAFFISAIGLVVSALILVPLLIMHCKTGSAKKRLKILCH